PNGPIRAGRRRCRPGPGAIRTRRSSSGCASTPTVERCRPVPFPSVKMGVPGETAAGERRVALVPETATKLVAAGLEVSLEAGAGRLAGFRDEAYREVGVALAAEKGALLSAADVVFKVQPPDVQEVGLLKKDALLISFLQPATQGPVIEALARQGVTAFSLELLPRISRAQSMDALSSQGSLAGYKAVLMAANRLGKYFPMLMSAAGTVPPARVLVLRA